jgi:hypothetical protein
VGRKWVYSLPTPCLSRPGSTERSDCSLLTNSHEFAGYDVAGITETIRNPGANESMLWGDASARFEALEKTHRELNQWNGHAGRPEPPSERE